MALIIFGPDRVLPGPGAALVTIRGDTDSQVSASVVAKGASTSFPLCAVAMELAAQLEARSATLNLEWAPRYMNEEADALTNGDFSGFDPKLRRSVNWERLPWLHLPDLMQRGAAFYAEMKEARAARRISDAVGPTRKRPRGHASRLRFKEPW